MVATAFPLLIRARNYCDLLAFFSQLSGAIFLGLFVPIFGVIPIRPLFLHLEAILIRSPELDNEFFVWSIDWLLHDDNSWSFLMVHPINGYIKASVDATRAALN